MKPFLSISFLIHFVFFSMASILFSDFKTESLPSLHVEVTLYPWTIEEKKANVSIRKEKKETLPLPSPTIEVTGPFSQLKTLVIPNIPVSSPRTEVMENPVSQSLPLPVEDRKKEWEERWQRSKRNPSSWLL